VPPHVWGTLATKMLSNISYSTCNVIVSRNCPKLLKTLDFLIQKGDTAIPLRYFIFAFWSSSNWLSNRRLRKFVTFCILQFYLSRDVPSSPSLYLRWVSSNVPKSIVTLLTPKARSAFRVCTAWIFQALYVILLLSLCCPVNLIVISSVETKYISNQASLLFTNIVRPEEHWQRH
jgi:hypothetical protein